MRKNIKIVNIFRIALILSLIFGQYTWAASGGPYELSWTTIDGGGGQSSGGQYTLTGTAGQPDASYSAGGDYEVLGGFWPAGQLCFVNFQDYARFAQYWMQSGPGLPADLYQDNTVDSYDLEEFAYQWLCNCPYDWPLK